MRITSHTHKPFQARRRRAPETTTGPGHDDTVTLQALQDVQPKKKLKLAKRLQALGLSAASKVGEHLNLGLLALRALRENKPGRLGDRVRALKQENLEEARHARIHKSNPPPPLGAASTMAELPTAQLQRPLMVVPGWSQAHDRFLTLTEKLTEDEANGAVAYYLQNGEFFADQDCRTPLPEEGIGEDTKVFVTVFEELGESAYTAAPQLKKNLEAVSRVTGSAKSDLVAYSHGGLVSRKYLDEGGQAGKLLMLGTPNYGSSLANVSRAAYDAQEAGYDVSWLMEKKHLGPVDEATMRLMATDSEGLADLNSRWDEQVTKTEGTRVVGADTRRTLQLDFPPFAPGDGTVEAHNLTPSSLEPVLLQDTAHTKHYELPYNAQAYEEMIEHFQWEV